MGLINFLTGGAIKAVAEVVDKFVTTDEEEIRLEIEQKKLEYQFKDKLIQHLSEVDKAQSEINKVEAASSRLFIAGWRPALGWVCVLCFFYSSIIYPIASPYLELYQLDTNIMMSILMGMLGLGSMRTLEKIKNVEKNR